MTIAPLAKHRLHGTWLLDGIAVGLLLMLATSCSQPSRGNPIVEARLGRLGLCYGLYAGSHEGKPPNHIDQLREYVERSTSPEQLSALNVDRAAELFVSPRDGQPYKMIALPRLPPPVGGQPPPVVLYEEQGEQGKRYVAYLGGGVEEVDADKFKQLVPNVQ